jgi:beta-galactosidase
VENRTADRHRTGPAFPVGYHAVVRSMKTRAVVLSLVLVVGSIGLHGHADAFARQRVSINSMPWKFKKGHVRGAEQPGFSDADWLSVKLPHDFNGGIDGVNGDVFAGPKMYRGPGWYRVHFTVDPLYAKRRVFIDFEGVSLVADVWLNGKSIGRHEGAFTGFSLDATANVKFGADNVLVVKADSANDSNVAPWVQIPFAPYPTSYDYAFYGGIYRDVFVTVTGDVTIRRALVSTPEISASTSRVRVRTDVLNAAEAAASVSLRTEILDAAGKVVGAMTDARSVDAGKTATFDQASGAIAAPRLWSPDDPYLYKVVSTATVDEILVDQIASPLGFRWFTAPKPGTSFVLNGTPMPIRGVNQHQDRKGLGWALTNEQHRQDLVLIKSAGFNAVRSSHYPVDPSYLDAADEIGLLLWIEVPVTTNISQSPEFLANAKSQMSEMVLQGYSHPSIFLWGIGNESDQNIGAAGLTEAYTNHFNAELVALAHQLDDTRPTTGCNFRERTNASIVDAYSPQSWDGWYAGVYTDYSPDSLVGEYGADSEVTRHEEPGTEKRWSQEYQCRLHEYYLAQGEAKKGSFPGQFAYLMFDFASARKDRAKNPIKFTNQKGLMLGDRTPKDVFYLYQSMYTDKNRAPMVYIVSHTWLDRWTGPAAKTVWVYSNCDEVELFNSDDASVSLGVRKRTAGEHPTVKTRFQWDNAMVRFKALRAEARVGGRVVARDAITLENLPAPQR